MRACCSPYGTAVAAGQEAAVRSATDTLSGRPSCYSLLSFLVLHALPVVAVAEAVNLVALVLSSRHGGGRRSPATESGTRNARLRRWFHWLLGSIFPPVVPGENIPKVYCSNVCVIGIAYTLAIQVCVCCSKAVPHDLLEVGFKVCMAMPTSLQVLLVVLGIPLSLFGWILFGCFLL